MYQEEPIPQTHTAPRVNRLICAVFLKATAASVAVTLENIKYSTQFHSEHGGCDWAVVAYGGEDVHLDILRQYFHHDPSSTLPTSSILIYCSLVPEANAHGDVDADRGTQRKQVILPKPTLYKHLLPFLTPSFSSSGSGRQYDYIFLLDEDISLVGFDISTFISIVRTGVSQRVRTNSTAEVDGKAQIRPYERTLVAQPLVQV